MEKPLMSLYQALGDYFSGAHRRRLFSILTVVTYFGIIIFCHYFNLKASKETLEIVFSSITQALLSLVALLGVAAFFKLESLKHEEDRIIQLATTPNYTYPWLASKLNGKLIASGEQLLMAFEAILKEGEPKEPTLRFLNERLESLFINRKHVTTYVLNFTVLTFFTVLVSLLLLVISPFLVSHDFSILSLAIIFYLLCSCLFLVIKGLADAVHH